MLDRLYFFVLLFGIAGIALVPAVTTPAASPHQGIKGPPCCTDREVLAYGALDAQRALLQGDPDKAFARLDEAMQLVVGPCETMRTPPYYVCQGLKP